MNQLLILAGTPRLDPWNVLRSGLNFPSRSENPRVKTAEQRDARNEVLLPAQHPTLTYKSKGRGLNQDRVRLFEKSLLRSC